jgi:hypothetical protein
LITGHFPEALTPQQLRHAQEMLCFAALMCGWSWNSLQQPAFGKFLRCLRGDFAVPKAGALASMKHSLVEKVSNAVYKKLKEAEGITLAFDAWRNHHGTQTIGVCALTRTSCFVLSLTETEKETVPVLNDLLSNILSMLDGLPIWSVIADGAANVQRTCTETRGLAQRCLAHLANLVLKDASSVFARQFDQCKEVQQFFHQKSRARFIYNAEMQSVSHSTKLVEPCDTRWGSLFDCMESIVRNRETIDRAFAALRRFVISFGMASTPFIFSRCDDFDWGGKAFLYALDVQWWRQLSKIVEAYKPLQPDEGFV